MFSLQQIIAYMFEFCNLLFNHVSRVIIIANVFSCGNVLYVGYRLFMESTIRYSFDTSNFTVLYSISLLKAVDYINCVTYITWSANY